MVQLIRPLKQYPNVLLKFHNNHLPNMFTLFVLPMASPVSFFQPRFAHEEELPLPDVRFEKLPLAAIPLGKLSDFTAELRCFLVTEPSEYVDGADDFLWKFGMLCGDEYVIA